MIRTFAKEQKVPTLIGKQVQRGQDVTAAAEKAHVRSSVHQLQTVADYQQTIAEHFHDAAMSATADASNY